VRRGRGFRLLWGFDAFIAATFLFFSFWGLADGTVSSFNRAAVGILLVLAIPGMLGVLFFLAVMILQPHWN
jgi:hypothetical protein